MLWASHKYHKARQNAYIIIIYNLRIDNTMVQ